MDRTAANEKYGLAKKLFSEGRFAESLATLDELLGYFPNDERLQKARQRCLQAIKERNSTDSGAHFVGASPGNAKAVAQAAFPPPTIEANPIVAGSLAAFESLKIDLGGRPFDKLPVGPIFTPEQGPEASAGAFEAEGSIGGCALPIISVVTVNVCAYFFFDINILYEIPSNFIEQCRAAFSAGFNYGGPFEVIGASFPFFVRWVWLGFAFLVVPFGVGVLLGVVLDLRE